MKKQLKTFYFDFLMVLLSARIHSSIRITHSMVTETIAQFLVMAGTWG
jgi:hypothetical protein